MATIWATVLGLPDPGGGDEHALRGGQGAQRRDRELARHDDHHHPGRGELQLDQRDEGGGGEDLVGRRVEELAEPGHLLAPAGEEAVEEVGQRGEQEDRQADELLVLEARLGEQHHDQERHQQDAEEREDVRQVHHRGGRPAKDNPRPAAGASARRGGRRVERAALAGGRRW